MKTLNYVVTCKNRFLGRCQNCERDYDPNNRPNNYDCPGYEETRFFTFNVVPNQDRVYESEREEVSENSRN